MSLRWLGTTIHIDREPDQWVNRDASEWIDSSSCGHGMPTSITFFTRKDCELCDAAWFVVRKVVGARAITVNVVDISDSQAVEWVDMYRDHIPVLHINDEEFCRHRVVEKDLRAALSGCL